VELINVQQQNISFVEFGRGNVTLLKSFQATPKVRYVGTKYRTVNTVHVAVKRVLIVREA
jgi:hypothetical protein